MLFRSKQAKVARELKYHSSDTDLAALQQELSTTTPASADPTEIEPDYSKWIEAEDDEDAGE